MSNEVQNRRFFTSQACLVAGLAFPPRAWTDSDRWHPMDLSFAATVTNTGTATTTGNAANSYLDVSMEATFTGPGNSTLRIPGFYDGDKGCPPPPSGHFPLDPSIIQEVPSLFQRSGFPAP